MSNITNHAGRRAFLKRAGFLSALAGTPFAANLMAIGAASAQSADYKALVCIYLAGGNDQSNTIVPYSGSEYSAYAAARPNIALRQDQLLKVSPQGWAGPTLSFNSNLAGLKGLFHQGHLAVVANVGTLAAPLTSREWNNGSPSVAVPYQLFSHSDQAGAWQTGVPDKPSATGWLGRIGDLTAGAYNSASQLSIAMSVAGNNQIQAGSSTIQYQLTTAGAVKVNALQTLYSSQLNANVLKQLVTAGRTNILESELNKISARAIASEALVNSAIGGVTISTAFPGTEIGAQLKMVARMIAARSPLSQRRQIFFVQAGGYDFHDNLLTDQNSRLKELSEAMTAFYQTTAELGVSEDVTTFTASDFGRGLQSNGRGADHGWGGHHFVMGGDVKGNSIYGTFPTVALKTAEDAGQGRLIPTTSVDEYAATLARWFGVSSSDLVTVLPNLGRFAKPNLGFLA